MLIYFGFQIWNLELGKITSYDANLSFFYGWIYNLCNYSTYNAIINVPFVLNLKTCRILRFTIRSYNLQFHLPSAILRKISILTTLVLTKYWWGQTRNEKKIHWINWKRLCTPKNRDGMGFRDIHAFNFAMLPKQAWRLVTGSHSLFYRVYKARYFPGCSFMDAKLGHNPSFVWRSLLAARDVIRVGSMWKIGDGQSIKITCNKWLQHPPSIQARCRHYIESGGPHPPWIHAMESSLDTGHFHASYTKRYLQLSNTRARDRLYWKENKAQQFTVKTAYQVALRLNREVGVEHSRREEVLE